MIFTNDFPIPSGAQPPVHRGDLKAAKFQAPTTSPKPNRDIHDTVRFGANPAANSASSTAGKKAPGLLQAFKLLVNHVRHADNREVVKGLAYKYGPMIGTPLMLAMPFGWVVAAVAALPAFILSNRGDKIIQDLKTKGVLQEGKGPLYRIATIQTHWKEGAQNTVGQVTAEYNRLLDELLPDNGQGIASVRDRLKLKEGGKLFGVLNHAFNVRMHYANRWQGKLLKGLHGVSSKIPFKPLRLPLLITGWALQGLLMLTSHRLVRKAAATAVKKAV